MISGLLLLSKNDTTLWDSMFEKLDEFSDDFMENRHQLEQTREELF